MALERHIPVDSVDTAAVRRSRVLAISVLPFVKQFCHRLRAIHKGIDGQQFSSVRDKYDAEGAEIKAVFGPTKREVLNDVRPSLNSDII